MARFFHFRRSCPEQPNAHHFLPVTGERCRFRVTKATGVLGPAKDLDFEARKLGASSRWVGSIFNQPGMRKLRALGARP